METIEFKNIKYPIRSISFHFGERIIGTDSLNDALMTENGGYVSEETRMIDECIFYFVEDNSFCLNDEQLSICHETELETGMNLPLQFKRVADMLLYIRKHQK